MSRLIFGCGYLGTRVARRWLEAGEQVFIVTRSAERAQVFEAEGYMPIVADVCRPETLTRLPVAQTVLHAVGFDRASGATMRDVFVDGLRAALDALPRETGKFIFISSTGVYGQSNGEVVDEDSPCHPQREGGRVTLAAEQTLKQHLLGERAIILRMAGLYGPGRVPYIKEIRAGEPIEAVESGYLNLIHVDDAASVVIAADERSSPPGTLVVSDGRPVERKEYFAQIARALNAPPPRMLPPRGDSHRTARAATSKRVDNRRMIAQLNVALRYPSYREGLSAILSGQR